MEIKLSDLNYIMFKCLCPINLFLKQKENPSNVPAAISYHIRFFMGNFLYLPNFGSLEHPYGLEEAPVVQ